VTELCELLGYSKQAYYKGLQQKEKNIFEQHIILDLVKKKTATLEKMKWQKPFSSSSR